MRVIAGKFRGRGLRSISGGGTRPTTERARAALFDWMEPWLPDARVLDLFAGSGALGIEALSRGAAHATFVERDRRARLTLRENLEQLGLCGCSRVLGSEVSRALQRLASEQGRFDLILADPPYGGGWTVRVLALGTLQGLLAPQGALVLESDAGDQQPSDVGKITLDESRSYGRTRFDRYRPEEVVRRGSRHD